MDYYNSNLAKPQRPISAVAREGQKQVPARRPEVHVGDLWMWLQLMRVQFETKIKRKSKFPPPDPGRNRPKTTDPQRKMTMRSLPRTSGEEGDKNKI